MFSRIDYRALNSRQKENYNFHKAAGILADYGFNCLRLNDDWQGADFLAVHIDGLTTLRIQMKSRVTIEKKYIGKNLHLGFLSGGDLYLCPHDEPMTLILAETNVERTKSWLEKGGYSWGRLSVEMAARLEKWRVRRVETAGMLE